jgi:hypothetical protein
VQLAEQITDHGVDQAGQVRPPWTAKTFLARSMPTNTMLMDLPFRR